MSGNTCLAIAFRLTDWGQFHPDKALALLATRKIKRYLQEFSQ